MENLTLVDFNDLFVIAVGITMAYIVIEKRKEGKSFFSFLSKMTNIVQTIALDRKTQPQQNEEKVISRIQYYLSSNLLQETTKGALDLVSRRAKDVMAKVLNLELWFKKKMEFHTKTDYLNVISCDSFIYGLFILFIGAFQNKCKLSCDGLIEWMLLYVTLCLFHCLLFEKLEVKSKIAKILQPSIFFHSIVAIVFLIIGITYCDSVIIEIKSGWLPILSVIACFIGFVVYLLSTILANIILMFVMLIRIMLLNINKEVAKQKEDIARYQQELDTVDTQLRSENLNDVFTLVGGDNVTNIEHND